MTAMKWKRKYGPVLGIDFASFPCVIISDYRLAKEAFALESFAGRPALPYFNDRSGGPAHGDVEGITCADGRTWREQRAFTHRALRQLGGFGTRSMEAIILKEMHEFVRRLEVRTVAAAPMETETLFNVPVVNITWGIIDRRPFDQDDPELSRIARLLNEGFAGASVVTMLSLFIPWFYNNFPDWMTGRKGLERTYLPIIDFMEPHIEEHWRTHTPGQPRDFIDAYIDEIKHTTDPDSSFHASRAKHALSTTLMDLFITGSETSSTTLRWVFLFLARFPDVQARAVAEIESVIGVGTTARPPSLADRLSMPYVEACLHEVMRFRPLAPLAAYHNTTEPVRLHGFDFPKDTMVYINIYEAHHNRELWGDPENFRPERWLKTKADDDSKPEFVRREGFLAFSTGRRVCLGEQLARDSIFLFTVGLLQKFRIKLDPNGPPPSLDPAVGGSTAAPKPHKLLFKLRD